LLDAVGFSDPEKADELPSAITRERRGSISGYGPCFHPEIRLRSCCVERVNADGQFLIVASKQIGRKPRSCLLQHGHFVPGLIESRPA